MGKRKAAANVHRFGPMSSWQHAHWRRTRKILLAFHSFFHPGFSWHKTRFFVFLFLLLSIRVGGDEGKKAKLWGRRRKRWRTRAKWPGSAFPSALPPKKRKKLLSCALKKIFSSPSPPLCLLWDWAVRFKIRLNFFICVLKGKLLWYFVEKKNLVYDL